MRRFDLQTEPARRSALCVTNRANPVRGTHVDSDQSPTRILLEIAQNPVFSRPLERIREMLQEERFCLFPRIQLPELVFRAKQSECE